MRVVVACDSFGGTLSAREAATAIAEGWARERPDDRVALVPMSDGGEGLLDVVHGAQDTALEVEVADPLGHPRTAWLSLGADGTAVVESAEACGLRHVATDRRDPLRATTYGVGELLDAAREAGARRILVGLGGSATVDGGAGALTGLGFALTVGDGSGLKVGGADLHRVRSAAHGWRHPDWDEVEVVLLRDVTTVLLDAPRVFGPQKGATPEVVEHLTRGLEVWADVAERDLAGGRVLRDVPGTGAAGGLGFGLAAGLGARFEPGAATVADRVRLDDTLRGADLVVTGEGRIDATSFEGKVVGEVVGRAGAFGVPAAAVVGGGDVAAGGLDLVERSAPDGPGPEPLAEVSEAAARLAARWASRGT